MPSVPACSRQSKPGLKVFVLAVPTGLELEFVVLQGKTTFRVKGGKDVGDQAALHLTESVPQEAGKNSTDGPEYVELSGPLTTKAGPHHLTTYRAQLATSSCWH